MSSERTEAFRIFLPIFGVLFALIVLATWFTILGEDNRTRERLADEESRQLIIYEEVLSRHFEAIIDDVRVLARSTVLKSFLEGNTAAARTLELEFSSYIDVAGFYDQLRIINSQGTERIRVNRTPFGSYIVPEHQLQDKADRYYFTDIIDMPSQSIYFSVFDLNVEGSTIELPLKPMIRIGIPIDTPDGTERYGVLLVNFLGDRMLTELSHSAESRVSKVMLLNDAGYWLYSERPEDRWGFMFEDRSDVNFGQRYPEAWNQISANDQATWSGPAGVFASRMVDPVRHDGLFDQEQKSQFEHVSPIWYVVSHIDADSLHEMRLNRIRTRLFIVVVSIAASLLIAIMLSNTIARNRRYRLELEAAALYDFLTKLPNRLLFSDRFEMVRASAIRTSTMVTLLFVDLDWFKQVNDSYGHDAGDELLVQVALRMVNTLRSTDTVARMGGDEFVVLLAECTTEEIAEHGAEKLRNALHKPFKLSSATVTIGASIGVCVATPENGLELEDMIKRADGAMYEAKRKGKGTVVLVRRESGTTTAG